jgi:predicted MFS family arabinose efflux permease
MLRDVTPATQEAPSPGAATVPRRARVVVAALAVSQTVGYGCLYYAFAVLLVPMAADLHASTTEVTGALTAATLAGAVSAVPVGRWLDRHGGRALMTVGSLLGTVLLLLAAAVDDLPSLYAVWTGLGLVSGAVLYEAAFAVVVAWFPDARQRGAALLAVTVVAGFASSIFFPLTGRLVDAHGWRTALVVLAGVHGLTTVPLHLLVRRPRADGPVPGPRPAAHPRHDRRAAVAAALGDRAFWVLTAAFVAEVFAVSVVGVHLVAYLVELGHPPAFAATIAGLLGVLSVTGRVVTTVAQRRRPLARVVAGVFALQALGVALLPLLGRSTAGAVGCVLAFGLGFGVGTIARPALVADGYGTAGFATIAGVMTVPLTVTKALAPLSAAALHGLTGDYTATAVTTGAACALAAVLLLWSRPGGQRTSATPVSTMATYRAR